MSAATCGSQLDPDIPALSRGSSALLCEHDLPALDLRPVEAHQPLAMRTGDRKLTRYGKPEVRMTAAKSRLLKCDQSGAGRIVAPDCQIPLSRRREIYRQLGAFRMVHPDLWGRP